MTGAGPSPHTVRVRMYQVGFGDCFLLSAEYAAPLPDGRAERHVLIDCGSTRQADGTQLADVADLVARHTAGRLDVLVITHRHKDHLSAFGLDVPGRLLEGLRPTLVLRPWTEDPAAPADATAPLGDGSRRLAAALQAGRDLAAGLAAGIRRDRGLRGDLVGLALAQLANEAAILRLDAMAAAGEARYLSAGQPSGIDDVVPGMTAHVLGPPTVEQWPAVATQAADNPEYWISQARLFAEATGNPVPAGGLPALAADGDAFAAAPGGQVCRPGPARWLIDRMTDRQVTSLQRIVRSLDDAMNNTSLLLLLDVAGQRLLFPGDAQIENWSYALSQPATTDLLRTVTLYKVGHHGSRNGTPRSLVRLWQQDPTPRVAMMSTLPGVHGQTEGTRVPRATLVTALEQLGPLHRTDTLARAEHHLELECRLQTGVWERKPPAP